MKKKNQSKKNGKSPPPKKRSKESVLTVRPSQAGFRPDRGLVAAPVATTTMLNHYLRTAELTIGRAKGMLMTGRCLVGYAFAQYVAGVPGNSGFPLLDATGLGSFTQGISLNPYSVFTVDNSQEYLMSTGYSRFRFRKLSIIYNGRVSTGVGGSLWLGYYPDGAYSSGDFTLPGQLGFLPGSYNTNAWTPCAMSDITPYLQEDWCYTDEDSAPSDAGLRQSYQGAVVAYWDPIAYQTGLATQVSFGTGQVWFDYELELLDPVGVYNLALNKSARRNAGRSKLSLGPKAEMSVASVPEEKSGGRGGADQKRPASSEPSLEKKVRVLESGVTPVLSSPPFDKSAAMDAGKLKLRNLEQARDRTESEIDALEYHMCLMAK